MSRRFYLWLAAAGFVLVSALYVAQQWIPDPSGPDTVAVDRTDTGTDASTDAGADTTLGTTVVPERSEERGADDPLVLVALIVGGTSLLASAAAWWQASGASGPLDGQTDRGGRPSETELEAADRLAGTLAPAVTAASQLCQVTHAAAQLGEEAPEGMDEQVAAARERTAELRQQLEAELMRDATLLPTSVLQPAHDVEAMIESLLADERLAQMQGAMLATQLQVTYYTFAGSVRAWAGLQALDVERLLGGEDTSGDSRGERREEAGRQETKGRDAEGQAAEADAGPDTGSNAGPEER